MVKFKSLFDRSGLSLDRLRSYALIAEAGGLSKAAGGEPAKMSLFSKQMRELEGFFGTRLTCRRGKVVMLTDAGRQLAQVAHLALHGLEDFQNSCKAEPDTLHIAASNSVLEWLLLPRVAAVRKLLPNTRFELRAGRTRELESRLTDMTLDLALLREDAISPPLKAKRVFTMTYSLFTPSGFVLPAREKGLKGSLAAMPLATSTGGQFREHLEQSAAKAGWSLNLELSCSSFTQAAQAVHSGAYAAVLPTIAAAQFAGAKVSQMQLPFLKAYARPICLAWNPRLTAMRPAVTRAANALEKTLKSA